MKHSLAGSLAGLSAIRRPAPAQDERVQRIAAAFTAGKLAKRNDPKLEPTKVFLDRESKIAATRKYQDACRRDPAMASNDFSDLMQQLLDEYLRA